MQNKDLSGIFVAKVINNIDPLERERILVRAVGLHDLENSNENYGVWAEHGIGSNFIYGNFPKINSMVYIMFIKDINNEYDFNKCLYFGVVRNNI
jgi:hypothetical protein